MKKAKMAVLCAMLSGSLLFSSCIGSFSAWNSLKDWNLNVGNKFANEVVFLAFHIIPVYEVAYLVDVLVLNSIEFWSGSNPLADVGSEKVIQGENGKYIVRINEDGYTIIKEGEENRPLDLVYDQETRTWNAVAEGQNYELMTMNEDGSITYKQEDGTPTTLSPELLSATQAKAGQIAR